MIRADRELAAKWFFPGQKLPAPIAEWVDTGSYPDDWDDQKPARLAALLSELRILARLEAFGEVHELSTDGPGLCGACQRDIVATLRHLASRPPPDEHDAARERTGDQAHDNAKVDGDPDHDEEPT